MGQRPGLWAPLVDAPFFGDLERRLTSGSRGVCISGLVHGARGLVLGLLAGRTGRRLCVVGADDTAVEAYQREFAAAATLLGLDASRIALLPALDADPYGGIEPHPEVVRERVVALGGLIAGTIDVLLVPARALLHPLPTAASWRGWIHTVREGQSLAPERFVMRLLSLGYRRVDIVSAPGEVSRRGGIIDVFPPSANEPVRVELFGDTVESLRSFDTDHQRSTGRVGEFLVGPATENPPTDEAVRRLSDYLESRVGDKQDGPPDVRRLRARLDQLREQRYLPGFESLARLTGEPALLFDLAQDMALVVDEPERTETALLEAAHDQRVAHEQADDRILPPPARLFGDPREGRDRLRDADLYLQELAGEEPGPALHVGCRPARGYAGRVAELAADLERAHREGWRTICVLRAPGSAERTREILGEYQLAPTVWSASDGDAPAPGGLFVTVAGLRSGFEFPELRLTLLTENELFGRERKSAKRQAGSRAAFISDFRDLRQGAHVVHVDHGIARFAGMGRPKGGSLNRDFMVLEFARGDRLFVPADRLDLVQKYSGVAGKKPVLDRLGGPGWQRIKARVRKSVESMAKELLELYARRRAARGHAFSPDTPWQAELEDSFPFELTVDQERALADIKRDMESERPTDRLLVGDVGFGKTEVAVRAAFKAVMDGYQVAVLAPTTVLAFQHYQTFLERFAPFPTRVAMVSRFRTAAEIREILRDLQAGAVDVVIGTHRLLSKDVHPKKLGLLVVDEEQRFGVRHKERLKKMAIGIDVLSMTATPIPRTLQMSLAGVRDLSVIETPPPGRLAIQTYIVPFRKAVLAQAVRQELRRGGQIFVVHNRVETLPAIARAVSEMAPGARLVTAHGQMPERHLEAVMLRFVNHEADVLITTTIIENGLDIPRANTIIVNRADRFGLAQLYQLRGRVGRSRKHAYAYFVVPDRGQLGDDARKRLKALQDFSELGSGFRLAAADLEIRGAGELLGSRQHGHIASLGFDLYCQMLERAVHELQGEPVVEREPVTIHLGVDIKIAESYLPDSADRLVVYKRLAQLATVADIDQLQAETEDRYGHLPPGARNLFDMGRLRLRAEVLGLRSVHLVDDTLQLRFHDEPPIELPRLLEFVGREGGALAPSGTLRLPAPERGANRVLAVDALLGRLAG